MTDSFDFVADLISSSADGSGAACPAAASAACPAVAEAATPKKRKRGNSSARRTPGKWQPRMARGIQRGTAEGLCQSQIMHAAKSRKAVAKERAQVADVAERVAHGVNVHGALRSGVELVVRRCNEARPTKRDKVQIIMRRGLTKGKGSYHALGPRARLEMAFNVDGRKKSLARQFSCHPKTAARNSNIVAEVSLMCQDKWIEACLEGMAAQGPQAPKPAVVVAWKWDETRESVRLSSLPGAAPSGEQDSVEIMVSSCRVVIMSPNSCRAITMDLALPPCPLKGNSAEDIFAALTRHPAVRSLASKLEALLALAEHPVDLSEFDGFSANDRLHAHRSNDPRYKQDGVIYEAGLCHNHSEHLSTIVQISSMGLNLITDAFCSALFLGSQGHWRRMLHAVQPAVTKHLRVLFTPRPRQAEGYGEAFKNILMQYARTHDDRRSGNTRVGRQLEADYEEFITFFAGAWWVDEDGWWDHHCMPDGSCCPGNTPAEIQASAKTRAARVVLRCPLRAKPKPGAKNKWSKLVPSFDFWTFGAAPHNMLLHICEEALGPLTSSYMKKAASDMRQDPTQMSWHSVAGSRLRRLLAMLRNPAVRRAHKHILVLCAPGRALTLHFMRCAEGQQRHGRPVLCDFASAATSPIQVLAQFYSSMLQGTPESMRVIWQAGGATSFVAWAIGHPEEVCLTRREIILAAACLRRRHGCLLEEPCSWASLVDSRVSLAARERMLAAFETKAVCHTKPGLARTVKQKGINLRSRAGVSMVYAYSCAVTLSLSNTERLHAVNKAFSKAAGGCAAWVNLASNAVNMSTRSAWRQSCEAATRASAALTPAARQPALASSPPAPPSTSASSSAASSSSTGTGALAVPSASASSSGGHGVSCHGRDIVSRNGGHGLSCHMPQPAQAPRPGRRTEPRRARAKSAKELFRDDYNRRRILSGDKFNPVSKPAQICGRGASVNGVMGCGTVSGSSSGSSTRLHPVIPCVFRLSGLVARLGIVCTQHGRPCRTRAGISGRLTRQQQKRLCMRRSACPLWVVGRSRSRLSLQRRVDRPSCQPSRSLLTMRVVFSQSWSGQWSRTSPTNRCCRSACRVLMDHSTSAF